MFGDNATSRNVNFFTLLLGVLVVSNAYLYLPAWGGDPEIHIIFAKNLLAGHPLSFNAGEQTSGETSPAYMIIVAVLVGALGPGHAAVAMKVIGGLSSLITAHQIFLHLRWRGVDRSISTFVSLCFLAYPFVLFQGLLGMENMLFTLAVVFFCGCSSKIV